MTEIIDVFVKADFTFSQAFTVFTLKKDVQGFLDLGQDDNRDVTVFPRARLMMPVHGSRQFQFVERSLQHLKLLLDLARAGTQFIIVSTVKFWERRLHTDTVHHLALRKQNE